MKVLELFSGSKVLSETFEERGHDTFTVDKCEEYDPDMAADILAFDVGDLPEEFRDADVVWASPPCTTFSTASLGHYWEDGEPSRAETYKGISIVAKTLYLIEKIGPAYWFVENPQGMLGTLTLMEGLRRVKVTYCQYGEDYMKPTHIWTNSDWSPRSTCSYGDSCHENVGRGVQDGVQAVDNAYEKAKIPRELCDEIARYCEGEPVNNHKLTRQGLERIRSGCGGGVES